MCCVTSNISTGMYSSSSISGGRSRPSIGWPCASTVLRPSDCHFEVAPITTQTRLPLLLVFIRASPLMCLPEGSAGLPGPVSLARLAARVIAALSDFRWTKPPSTERVSAALRKGPIDDHEIRQLLLRHRRHGEARLRGYADQRAPLFEGAAGRRDAQGRDLCQVHGRARLRHVL